MGNCSVCNAESGQKSNVPDIKEVDLEKKDIEIFEAPQDNRGFIDFSNIYTTAPVIKKAKTKITEWIQANNEVESFEKVEWKEKKEIECEICLYTYDNSNRLLEEQDPLAYSYWKGIDIKEELIGEELTIMTFEKSNETRGICAGCFFRNEDLKKINSGES